MCPSVKSFWPLVAVLLGAMAAVQVVTVRGESQIYDESNQLLSGYTYLTSGRFTTAVEQPPLVKLLWAVAVAALRPSPPPEHIAVEDPWPAGREFLYRNRVPADAMLMAGRSCAIAISILLGVAIAYWGKRLGSARGAAWAVCLYALDPNFLAHGRYMKNDVAAALLIFVGAMTWGAWLMRPSRKLLWLSGMVLGLGIAAKFSALILPPVFVILYAIRRWQERRAFVTGACLRPLGGVALIACVVVFAVYGFEIRPLGDSGIFRRLAPGASWAASIPVPAMSFFRGLGEVGLKQTATGHAYAYLLGERSQFGWWYMTPVALAVKTPLAVLALLAVVAGVVIGRCRRVVWRDVEFKWFVMAVPPAAYLALALGTHFHAGIRHLLPIYPFLFVFAACVLCGGAALRWRWRVALGGAALLAVESAGIYPHYLAFFNALAGGPAGGQRYLVDSNLDWGQDVKNLKRYLDAHGVQRVSISYFGMADLDYYGIRHEALPDVRDLEAARRLDAVAAISVTNLALEPGRWAGLAALRPDARIGYSINVYDLRVHRR
jgi:hypothetical protein